MAKKIYNVLRPLHHNNVKYIVGETVDLEEEMGSPLVKLRVVEDTGKLAAVAPSGAPADPVLRQAAIVEAIGKLDKENTDMWLRDGKPNASSIAEITGWPVSAAERNEAWASMQPAQA